MIRTLRWLTTVAVALSLGCAARTPSARPGDPGVLHGTVSYMPDDDIPNDAVIEIWVTDMSPDAAALPVIGQTTFLANGRSAPLPFQISYDPSRVDVSHPYTIRAVIRSDGRMLFVTPSAVPVITQGHPSQIDLVLTPSNGPAAADAAGSLTGSAWRLVQLSGAAVLERVEATLEFSEPGRVSGNGSCNLFFGSAQIGDGSIAVAPVASTRRACVEAVGDQEQRYLEALQAAERFELEDDRLTVYSKGASEPLRFARIMR